MTSEFSVAVHALVFLNHKGTTYSSEGLAENICTNPARIRKVMAKLKKVTLLSVIISTIFGGIIGSSLKGKFWLPTGIITGIMAGFGIGAAISSNTKNKLMDEYGVKQFQEEQ